MKYSELYLTKELLDDVIAGKEIKADLNTKIDLAEVRDHFNNLILDIDKQKRKSNEDVMVYRLAIEVKK